MYYINKIVGWVFSPLGMLFLGLGCAWALGCARETKKFPRIGRFLLWLKGKRSWIVGIALSVLWSLGCGITTRLIGVPLEGDEIDAYEMPAEDVGHVDAIVLLGGGMGIHKECGRGEMFGGADRVWLAARLWKKFHLPVTISGGAAQGEKAFLVDYGVPESFFLEFEEARNTEEEAKMIATALAARRQCQSLEGRPRILLVTSAWHMPRSKMLFERECLEVIPASTDYEMTCAKEKGVDVSDFFPCAESLARNSYCVKEWVARFFYWFKR